LKDFKQMMQMLTGLRVTQIAGAVALQELVLESPDLQWVRRSTRSDW